MHALGRIGDNKQCQSSLSPRLAIALLAVSASSVSCVKSCEFSSTCGDGFQTWDEECDGLDMGGQTCVTAGYRGGEISCSPGCTLDVSACIPPPGCGNGYLDPGEECDGEQSIFHGEVLCSFFGLSGYGQIVCGPGCNYDLGVCSSERCDNRWDDDGDGLVDCDDPDCQSVGDCPRELCYDGSDNDQDELIDCLDPDCSGAFPSCNAGLYPSEDAHHGLCGNDQDDDGDGLDDREDPDCLGYRSVLFLRNVGPGTFVRGGHLQGELLVYADATDLEQLSIVSLFPEEIILEAVYGEGFCSHGDHALECSIDLLPWGDAYRLEFWGWISEQTEFGKEICLSATLESATPLESWSSDDPDSVGQQQPSCIVVR